MTEKTIKVITNVILELSEYILDKIKTKKKGEKDDVPPRNTKKK